MTQWLSQHHQLSKHGHRVVAKIFLLVDDTAVVEALCSGDFIWEPAVFRLYPEADKADKTHFGNSRGNQHSNRVTNDNLYGNIVNIEIFTLMQSVNASWSECNMIYQTTYTYGDLAQLVFPPSFLPSFLPSFHLQYLHYEWPHSTGLKGRATLSFEKSSRIKGQLLFFLLCAYNLWLQPC